MNKSVTVIIPTIGSKYLKQCVDSVNNQTYGNIKSWVVCDGPEILYKDELTEVYSDYITTLPENTGNDNGTMYYGHRIYAAMSYLVNTDYVMFLDEDNWLQPEHVESLVTLLEKNHDLEWAYSLRTINNKLGNFECFDNCESLGQWKTWQSDMLREEIFHIDTSCYFLPRRVAVQMAMAWYGGYGQDRVFRSNLAHYFPTYDTNGKYTLNYRLDGNPNSLSKDFIIQGNAYMDQKYGPNKPWQK